MWKDNWPTNTEIHQTIDKIGIVRAAKNNKISYAVVKNHMTGKKVQVVGQPVTAGAPVRNTPESQNDETRTVIEIGKEVGSIEYTEQTLDPNKVPTDGELLKKANLDETVWEVSSRRSSVWEAQAAEGETKTLRSFRVGFSKIKNNPADVILPAFGGKPVSIKAPSRRKENKRDSELVVIVSDFHAPYYDEELLQACEQLLIDQQPDRLIVNGDVVDFPSVGRHRKTTTRCTASANECVQSGGEILARLRAAVPDDTKVELIPGNHDAWLNNHLLDRAEGVIDLCVSGTDIPVWSMENLFQLKSLGIDLVGEADTWPHSYVQLTDHLVVKHGNTARAGAGASPLAEMKSSDFATIHGHTHRAAVVSKTIWSADGKRKTFQGAEIGAMCKVEPGGWPTYTSLPDWSPGFATVTIEKDGRYGIDLATWQNGVLCWRGLTY